MTGVYFNREKDNYDVAPNALWTGLGGGYWYSNIGASGTSYPRVYYTDNGSKFLTFNDYSDFFLFNSFADMSVKHEKQVCH